MNKKLELKRRIAELEERISGNDYDIEHGFKDFKKYNRGDNRFCRGRLRELKKELILLEKEE